MLASGKPVLLLVFWTAAAISVLQADPGRRNTVRSQQRAGNVTDKGRRLGKILSIFQVITFPNDVCQGGSKNGTCYTAEECSARGGDNDGSCADGYGVCCTFTLNCGGSSSENCTHFESNSVAAGACAVSVCPCSSNICQLRLDFSTFVITGPQTSAQSAVKTKNGDVAAITGTAKLQSLRSQCLTDTFSVTSSRGVTPPVICGNNNGEHMYVDSDSNCNILAFQLGVAGALNQPGVAARQWSIKVTQFSCDFPDLAPSGCTQYFSGSRTGTLRSYNYVGGDGHLANQRQAFCVRRESGSCRICYSTNAAIEFDVSGRTDTAAALNAASCCQYGPGTDNEGKKGADCVEIPGAQNTANPGVPLAPRFCGMMGIGPVCSTQTPFVLTFLSDAYEGVETMGEGTALNAGFAIQFSQDNTACTPPGSGRR